MDSRKPLISIALCTFNGERYLREQLDSVLAQTYTDLEIVAVDDASTDETVAILREYEARDARVKVFVNATNIGLQKNFERAISLCAGSFIAPCDQDDIWLPEKLSTLLERIGTHALAYCDSEFIDENGHALDNGMSDNVTMVSSNDPVIFAVTNCVAGHAMLIRSEIAKRAVPIPDPFYYDWWLAAVAAAAGGIVYCDKRLVKYRLHTQNVTNYLRTQQPDRARGYRYAQLEQFRLRLEHLAALPGDNRKFIERLRDLWRAREDQFFSLRLAAFIFEHGPRIFALQRPKPPRLKHALRFAIGLRLKRISNPHVYARPEADA